MGILITIILGAFVGWIASIVTKRDAEQGWLGNIIIGIVGAFLGNFISSLLTGGDRSALVLDLEALLWAFAGAVVLCVIINYFQRGRVR